MASSEIKIKSDIPSIRMMATEIAGHIFQNTDLLYEFRDLAKKKSKAGNEMAFYHYVAMTAVETAHLIDVYAKQWETTKEEHGKGAEK